MSTAWAHLPNARHIDGILADVRERPWAWDQVFSAAWAAVRVTAQLAARDVARGAGRGAEWVAVAGAPGYATRYVVRDILAALLAWDDSARMLTMTPAALRTLIDITEGDVKHQAVLILPAVLAGYTGD